MSWRYAFASVIGTAHRENGLPCQDASHCEVIPTAQGNILLALASDGAGSATQADEGAQMCVSVMAEQISRFFQEGGSLQDIHLQQAQEWLLITTGRMMEMASARECSLRDYACTLLVAIVSDGYGVFMQLGDGCIVIADAEDINDYYCVFWPEKGMYANTTYFVTDNEALQHLQFMIVEKDLRAMAVFTDGIENLALQMADQSVFAPFFRGLFPAMLGDSFDSDKFTEQLSRFLDSERLNERTNDDKTLILAARPVIC